MRFSTKLIHAGEPEPRIGGALALPIFQTSTFEHAGRSGYHEVKYARLSNTPNHDALGAKLAALEGTEAGLVTASGMAAISAALLATLGAGDHLIAHESLYGGTHGLLTQDLAALGVEVTFVDANRPETFAAALRPKTRAFYVEAITNPLLQVVDLDAVVAFARAHGLTTFIDSTLATPVNFRPAERGFDLVLHSATKYLNGHTDVVAGAVAGSAAGVANVKKKLDHFGGSLDPHACFLLARGLKTLELRVERQNRTALAVAEHLSRHAAVAEVFYPGLPGHAGYARAEAWFRGAGGMLSFRPAGGAGAAERFLAALRLATSAPSLGGPETLVTRPVTTSHAGVPADERARLGIGDDLVRVSIGLEAVEDLLEDFERALG
ncbi:MAG TPA: aminotransferase class I/II-fold pyridoxal phosphate-dependent enzyme [Polyangiaceae bacterium]|nr:aminotransferase class I/II-fold pyridoxal phosphate-dependent enzyme [Polyangiaceae bacterium]